MEEAALVRVTPAAPLKNRLLDRLPAKELASLLACCERVELSFGETIARGGQAIPHVYFPIGSFISLMTPAAGRATTEVGLVGNEGMYGVGAALGVEYARVHALVQGSGSAWRIDAAAFRSELASSPALRKTVYRYVYVLLSQLVQTAECNRFHVVEQRLARRLLMTADRAHSQTFRITHEFLAYLLGTRRVGITEAASTFARRKLIAYARGSVAILDRRGLERASCPCYRLDLSAYDRIFG